MIDLLKSIEGKDIPVKSFKDVTKMQHMLYMYYCERNPKCLDKDFMCQQMVLAATDEYVEYCKWGNNHIEAMFEAIDLYHFALEGMLIIKPSTPAYTPQLRGCTAVGILNVCANILSDINWKHWKLQQGKTYVNAYIAFTYLCDYAYTLFTYAYARHNKLADDGSDDFDPEIINHNHLNETFFKYYYAKNMENFNRQKRGY